MAGGMFRAVADYPAQGENNTMYVNTADGSARFWNGASYQEVVKPTAKSIASTGGDHLHFPTTQAVSDYVTSKVASEDLPAIRQRITTLEGKMDVVQGTGTGSIAKGDADTLAAAKAYTDALRDGQVKTNKDNITIIRGTGEGSIKKALADAKAYTDALEQGQVTTNANDIDALEQGKADKATTIAGYGITDAYTKTEIDKKIADVDHLQRQVVATLPAVADADPRIIYMVPKADAAGDQNYDEYMVIDGKWEKIGDTKVDLTDYALKTEVATAKSEAIAAAATDATTKANNALSSAKAYTDALRDGQVATNKTNIEKLMGNGSGSVSDALVQAKAYTDALRDGQVTTNKNNIATIMGTGAGSISKGDVDTLTSAKSYADSLASNYATAAQGTKADTALQASDITTGSTNGTVRVKGTDIPVKGLGNAAYTNSSDYDAAGAANTALTNAKAYTDTSLTWNQL